MPDAGVSRSSCRNAAAIPSPPVRVDNRSNRVRVSGRKESPRDDGVRRMMRRKFRLPSPSMDNGSAKSWVERLVSIPVTTEKPSHVDSAHLVASSEMMMQERGQ